jgi:hypothetical protein
MKFKYEEKLSSYGLAAEQTGTGLQDKIKKFLRVVKEHGDLQAKLNTNISEDKKQAIREELEDIDISAADDRLAKAVETWYLNRDNYADRLKKMAEARAAKAKERGDAPKKPAEKPAPVAPPVVPPVVEKKPEVAPVPPVSLPVVEKKIEVAPVPPVSAPVVEKKIEVAPVPPVVAEPAASPAESEKKDSAYGFLGLVAAGVVLVFTGIWLKNRS